MNKYCTIVFFLCLFYFTTCKPYDSDAVNNQLIRGCWKLSSMQYELPDSAVIVPIGIEDTTMFYFENDSCFLSYAGLDLDSALGYKYNINNYKITTYIEELDTVHNSVRDILLLSADSLVFGANHLRWNYIRVSEHE